MDAIVRAVRTVRTSGVGSGVTTEPSSIEAVLFDFGGVLVRFEGLAALQELLPGAIDRDEATARWLTSEAVREFERGQQTDARLFAERAVSELELDLEPEEFLQRFESWVPEPLPGAVELVEELREELPPSIRIGCFSNTNPLHAQRILTWFPERIFDPVLLSFRTGYVKPDAAAFHHAVETLDLRPSRIWFGDDARPNVDGAAAIGLRAERVLGVCAARASLTAYGLLSPETASS